MAISNHERVGKTLEFLAMGLKPFVERELTSELGQYWVTKATEGWKNELDWADDNTPHLDIAALLRLMWDNWNGVFGKTLGRGERSLVSELRDARNRWAHQKPFSSDDTYRALDSASRLLTAVSACEADEVEKMKMELLRLRFDEQVRNEKKKEARATVESTVTGTLKPWREVVSPHPDVASGRYQQAEFAADLWQVHIGEGAPEYKDPVEFFRRTFMTESLTKLLVDAVRRFSGAGGDPVVQLQTNFGGGKTHSMLALYHLVSGKKVNELLGVEQVLKEAGVTSLPSIKRVVLVGNKLSPGNPSVKADGTVVHTLWGELAYQLGGRAAYDRIRADDERATSPGDKLREILNEFGPALILIDEWVAYARQLHSESDLPGGSFETQFSFAQALTESAKLAKNCLLVISLPASDTATSPHAQGDDIEVGGQRGREALERLRNVVGRVESSWRPASAEEGFEIVRRRLFEPLLEQDQFKNRDVVARSFYDLYRTQHQEFPPECRDAEYEERLRAAYPIHPEVFDRLYSDWSTLAKFQRTRGVLRLMAAVIHSLWEKGDRNPLILPCNVPIDDPRVQFELTRYLPDNWVPVIEKDVDGPSALPLRVDGEVPNLGRYHACRRVARTIYLGSAPTTTAANRGLEDRRVKLGCVMPGEQPPIFGDALRRLAGSATYLYQDGPRYWYSTQPTVTKLADDRAEQLKRDPDAVAQEIEKRAKLDLRNTGEFSRVHPFPQSGADVADDRDARLVVLGIEHPYSKEDGNAAEQFAREILRTRGNAPRLFQNSLAFLAVDKTKLQDLDESVRRFLAWESILAERETLDLSPHQVKQAETQKANADSSVTARLPEVFQWLLVPVQEEKNPAAPIIWELHPLKGDGTLAQRASKKLRDKDLLYVSLSPSRLKMELDRVPLWDGNEKSHVAISELVDYFGKYLYLPRLKAPGLLLNAVQEGIKLLTWSHDSFAYADSYDEESRRYRGLVCGRVVMFGSDIPDGVLVKPEVALQQLQAEAPEATAGGATPTTPGTKGADPTTGLFAGGDGDKSTKPSVSRFHGTVSLDATRVGRDAGRIADEVISHLSGIVGARVKVTLEIEADVPEGVPDDVIRVVTQNSRDLKFDSQGFESD
ncbi:MAG TPA: Swt1 family HEPN domain-containing protein [Fimbriimonadaceae bacterium]|jgi:predicted AAA+ superfamily ATPase|nr:Swt1 family HEPN domain-containing protein [Fimbriimonadaceae bacterium]